MYPVQVDLNKLGLPDWLVEARGYLKYLPLLADCRAVSATS
jgi:hypothetical protein